MLRVDLASGQRVELVQDSISFFCPEPSPDGTQILLSSMGPGWHLDQAPPLDQDIWVVSSDGSGLRVLFDSQRVSNYGRWSADGTQVVFQSDHHVDMAADYTIRATTDSLEVFILDAVGGSVRRLTSNGFGDLHPSW